MLSLILYSTVLEPSPFVDFPANKPVSINFTCYCDGEEYCDIVFLINGTAPTTKGFRTLDNYTINGKLIKKLIVESAIIENNTIILCAIVPADAGNKFKLQNSSMSTIRLQGNKLQLCIHAGILTIKINRSTCCSH